MIPHCYPFRPLNLGVLWLFFSLLIQPINKFYLTFTAVTGITLLSFEPGLSHHHLSCGLLQRPHHWSPCFHLCPLLQNTQREAIWNKLYHLTLCSNPVNGPYLSKIQSPMTSFKELVFLVLDIYLSSLCSPLLSDFHPPWRACCFLFQITSYPR